MIIIHKWFGLKNGLYYFAHPFMKRNRRKYSRAQIASAVLMIAALLWLTISAPFVTAAQQQMAKMERVSDSPGPLAGNEEEAGNPFGNNTEEKAPSTSFSEEYIHDHHITHHFFSLASQYHKCEDAGIYVAFHGELLVPPPNVA
jgi:hypothetical protein